GQAKQSGLLFFATPDFPEWCFGAGFGGTETQGFESVAIFAKEKAQPVVTQAKFVSKALRLRLLQRHINTLPDLS
ncbi:MAG TPA: hypothetical protein VM715_19865, partial [Candidatus Acidoferrum sp.]|nr:hypothetical protein [Candidatus Acidoferrum sp.]